MTKDEMQTRLAANSQLESGEKLLWIGQDDRKVIALFMAIAILVVQIAAIGWRIYHHEHVSSTGIFFSVRWCFRLFVILLLSEEEKLLSMLFPTDDLCLLIQKEKPIGGFQQNKSKISKLSARLTDAAKSNLSLMVQSKSNKARTHKRKTHLC